MCIKGKVCVGSSVSLHQSLAGLVACCTLFWPRTKLPLNWREPENNDLLKWKNTKEIIINHKETRIVKDGEDWHGFRLLMAGLTFKIRKPWVAFNWLQRATCLMTHWAGQTVKYTYLTGWQFGQPGCLPRLISFINLELYAEIETVRAAKTVILACVLQIYQPTICSVLVKDLGDYLGQW